MRRLGGLQRAEHAPARQRRRRRPRPGRGGRPAAWRRAGPRASGRASSGARSSSNRTGARGSSKCGRARGCSSPSQPTPRRRRSTRAERPGCSSGWSARSVVERARRDQRFEVALDVEEVDGRRGVPHCSGSGGAVGEAAEAQRLIVALPPSRRKQRPTSKMRTRSCLRARLVRSTSRRPPASVVRMTSRWLAIGFSTAIGARARRALGKERGFPAPSSRS